MAMATMTSKGRVTIPIEIRQQLAIEPGDQLFFEPDNEGGARFQVFHRHGLADLFGILPATRPYPGRDKVRREVAANLAREDRPEPG
jgi:AbrB family looped-hinge helix DNA binding protein